MSLVTNIISKIIATENLTGDLDSSLIAFKDRDPIQLPSGTGAGQADLQWSDTRTLGISASEELDLNALTDSLGRIINMVKVKAIHVRAAALNSNNVELGNAAATQFLAGFVAAAHRWAVAPGGSFLVTFGNGAAGWPSTNGVADKFKIANSGAGTSVTYDIEIIGTSA
jgi:hypothetical protein